MTKILMINDSCRKIGGAETHMWGLYELLKEKYNVNVFCVGKKNVLEKFIFSLKTYKSLRKIIKEEKPDIVHLHSNYWSSLSVLLAIRKCKVVQTVHDHGLICMSSTLAVNGKICEGVGGAGLKCLKCLPLHHFLIAYPRNRIRLMMSKKIIRKYIAPSNALKKMLERYGLKNVEHMQHFVKKEKWKGRDKKEKGLVIYVGILEWRKGIQILAKAMEKVNGKLTVIGNGSLRGGIKGENIELVGEVENERLVDYYKRANVVVFPSIWIENSPMVVYEALASGKPVIGTDIGGIPELIGDAGFVVRPGDAEKLAEKINMIIKDKRLYKKLCRNAKKKEFSREKYSERIGEIYEQARKS